MNWSNVEVLDVERLYYKRCISEMLHIKRQKNGLNLDRYCLNGAYTFMFNYL